MHLYALLLLILLSVSFVPYFYPLLLLSCGVVVLLVLVNKRPDDIHVRVAACIILEVVLPGWGVFLLAIACVRTP